MSIQRLRAGAQEPRAAPVWKGGAFGRDCWDWGQRTNEKERPRCYARMILVIAAMAAISGAVALSSTEASPLGRPRLGWWPRRFRQCCVARVVDGDGVAQDGVRGMGLAWRSRRRMGWRGPGWGVARVGWRGPGWGWRRAGWRMGMGPVSAL